MEISILCENVRVQAQHRSEVTSACTNGDDLAVSLCLDRREGTLVR